MSRSQALYIHNESHLGLELFGLYWHCMTWNSLNFRLNSKTELDSEVHAIAKKFIIGMHRDIERLLKDGCH